MDIKLELKIEPSDTQSGVVNRENHSIRSINATGVKYEVLVETNIQKNLVELDHNNIKLERFQWDKDLCNNNKDTIAVKEEKTHDTEFTYAEWIPEEDGAITKPINVKRDLKNEVTHNVISVKVESPDLDECLNAQGTLNQVQVATDSTPARKPSNGPLSDIKFKEIQIKNEIFGLNRVVIVINLKKGVFYERNFVCSVCMNVFDSNISLDIHKFDHSNLVNSPKDETLKLQSAQQKTLYKCDRCEFKSTWQSAFKRHKQLHTGEKPFECDQCSFTSARQSVLKRHKLSHTGERPFKCEQCNYTSAQKSDLKRHKLSHTGEKPYQCDQCSFKSALQFAFKQHKLWHTGERLFKCDQCRFSSATKCQLKYHKSKHSDVKPFRCDECSFTSALQFVLKRHKLSHTGEKPFKCDQCEFASGLKCNLKNHKLIHTGLKPFECDACDFKSAWRSALKQHKQLHGVDRPFKCGDCNFGFLRASDLKRHTVWHAAEGSNERG